MDVQLIDYGAVAEKARKELENLDLPLTTKKALESLITSFEEVNKEQEQQRWSSTWSGFSLRLPAIDPDVFNRFQRVASKMGKSPGYVLSYLMELALHRDDFKFSATDLKEFMEFPSLHIQHYPELTISGMMLEELDDDEMVAFSHIKSIEITKDVDPELFREKVSFIQHCKRVILPENYSSLLVLTKVQFCQNFSFI